MGLAVWAEDEAGPYQTVPYPGESWQPESHPVRQPHEYIRNGTAKMLTLFHPATGKVRVKGVTQSTNADFASLAQRTNRSHSENLARETFIG